MDEEVRTIRLRAGERLRIEADVARGETVLPEIEIAGPAIIRPAPEYPTQLVSAPYPKRQGAA